MKKNRNAKIMAGDIQLELTLPEPWLSRATWERMHWAAKGRFIAEQAAHFRLQVYGLNLLLPLINVTIHGVRASTHLLDNDNLYGGLKPYLDAMTERHTRGMGLILDDRPAIITGGLVATQHKVAADDVGSQFLISGTQTKLPE